MSSFSAEKEGFEIGHRHRIACVPRCAMRPDTISRGLKSRHWRDFALRADPSNPFHLFRPRKKAPYGAFFRGGEGGIRTLAPVTPAYSLSRGAPYSHLGTSPRSVFIIYVNVFGACIWRRERDSNPRCLAASPVFKTGSINHSDISPCLALSL